MKAERVCACEEYYRIVVNNDPDPTNYVYFNLAQCFIEGFDPQKLRILLASADDGLVSDGLFVLSEIGGLARDFAPEIRVLTNHTDPQIRDRAKDLASVYLREPES